MLEVVEFIKANKNWRELLSEKPYCVSIKEEDGFILLKYSQIDSDFKLKIVRECRGLILTADGFETVCVPFFKFGNYMEQYADEIDWNTAVAEEKVDGSIIKLWHYAGRWHVSTNGTIDAFKASLGSNDRIYTNFGILFKDASEIAGLDYGRLNVENTYMFELVSPYNRVVVPYKHIDLYHIGTRNNVTLKELDESIGIKKPKSYKCSDLSSIIEMAKELSYNEEGYVVKDADFNRVKVKSPAYVAVARLIEGMNDKRIIELLRAGEAEEFLGYFPEYTEQVSGFSEAVDKFIHYMEAELKEKFRLADFEDRKSMALYIKDNLNCPEFYFMYADGKVKTVKEWFWKQSAEKILLKLENFSKNIT